MTTALRPSPDPASKLLKELTRRLFRHLPKALAGDEEEIHAMRVAARRLRVALPLLAHKPRGKRVRRALDVLRDVTRAGGGSRDLDVSLALFDERLREAEGATSERKALRRSLAAARSRSRGLMAEAMLDLEIASLRRDLSAIQTKGSAPVFSVFLRLRKQAEKAHLALVTELDAIGERFDAPGLHQVRIGCRQLRYTAEVLDTLRDQESEAPSALRELQESLGRLHDAHVLACWLAYEAEKAQARGRKTLVETAQREREFFVSRAEELHRAFLATNPKAQLARVLTIMIPSRSAA
jgi:CHAD domain-containing protein